MRVKLDAFEADRVSLSVEFDGQEPTSWTITPQLDGEINTSHAEARAAYAAYVMGYPLAYLLDEDLVIDIPAPRSVIDGHPPASQVFACNARRVGRTRDRLPGTFFVNGYVDDLPVRRFVPEDSISYILPFSMGVDSSYTLLKAEDDLVPNLRTFVNNVIPQDNAPGAGHLWVRAPEFLERRAIPEEIAGLDSFEFLQQFWFNSWWAGVSALVYPPPAVTLFTATYWYGSPSDAFGYTRLPSTAPNHLYTLAMAGYQPMYVHGSLNRGQRIKGIADGRPEWLPRIRSCWSDAHVNCGRCEKCALNYLGLAAYGVPVSRWSFESNPLGANEYISGEKVMSQEGEDGARLFAGLISQRTADWTDTELSEERAAIMDVVQWMLQ